MTGALVRFDRAEPQGGLSRIIVLFGRNYIGIIAEQPSGQFEFIPHRGGSFCETLALPVGPHTAGNVIATRRLVHRLLARAEAPAPAPRHVAVRPDGVVWQRSFATEGAGWRALVRGTNTPQEYWQKKVEMARAGWTVRPVR